MMRPALSLLLVAGLAALVLPGRAAASTETVVLETAPITVTAFEVARGVRLAPSPKVDGYVVGSCSLHPARMTQLVIVR